MSHLDWSHAIARFGTESSDAGMELLVYWPTDAAILYVLAISGDARSATIIRAGDNLITQTKRLPKSKRPLCLCCPRRIIDKFGALAFLIPIAYAPTQAVGMFLCESCTKGLDRSRLFDAAKAALLRSWPDLREMPAPTHPNGGRA